MQQLPSARMRMGIILSFCLMTSCLLPSTALSQDVAVRVLGVPGWELLVKNLRQAGYRSSKYGPSGRTANDFQVISIGSKIPPEQAINIITLAKQLIPSLAYVILSGDAKGSATKDYEITIGATNSMMDQFRNAKPLGNTEFFELIRNGDIRNDLFYEKVRLKYIGQAVTESPDTGQKPYFRKDGIMVIPNEDGSAELVTLDRRRGFMTKEGEERWPLANSSPVLPVKEEDSVGTAWVTELNGWLKWISDRSLNDIEILLQDEESYNNYLNYENNKATTEYERLHFRRQYLTIVIDAKFRQ